VATPQGTLRERDAAGDPGPEPGGFSEIEALYVADKITLHDYQS